MKRTQYERIIAALKRGWLSPAQAFRECGTLKLATRCSDLKKRGYRIVDRWSASGKFKEYRLVKGC